jgi:hypothetical protein
MKNRGRTGVCGRLLKAFLLVVIFGMLLSAFCLWEKRDQQRIRASIDKNLKSLQSAGHPLSAQDMARLFPDPPADRDANRLLNSAFDLLSIPEDSTNIPFFSAQSSGNAPLDRAVIEESQRWVDRNQPALDAIPWDKIEGAWFGCGFTNGLTNLAVPRLTPFSNLIRLLCLDAVLQAEGQNPVQSVLALHRFLCLSRTLKNYVPVIFLSRSASEDRVCIALERLMNRAPVTDDALQKLAKELTITNAAAAKEVAIRTLPTGILMAETLRSQSSQLTQSVYSPHRWILRSIQAHTLYRDKDYLDYLEWNNRCLAAFELPASEAIPALLKIETENSLLYKSRPVSFINSWRKERISFLTTQELELTQFLLRELATITKVRETLDAVAIQRWRSSHNGQIPDSLKEVAAELPAWTVEDPFTGKSFKYTKYSHGFSLKASWPDGEARKLLPDHRRDNYVTTVQVGGD